MVDKVALIRLLRRAFYENKKRPTFLTNRQIESVIRSMIDIFPQKQRNLQKIYCIIFRRLPECIIALIQTYSQDLSQKYLIKMFQSNLPSLLPKFLEPRKARENFKALNWWNQSKSSLDLSGLIAPQIRKLKETALQLAFVYFKKNGGQSMPPNVLDEHIERAKCKTENAIATQTRRIETKEERRKKDARATRKESNPVHTAIVTDRQTYDKSIHTIRRGSVMNQCGLQMPEGEFDFICILKGALTHAIKPYSALFPENQLIQRPDSRCPHTGGCHCYVFVLEKVYFYNNTQIPEMKRAIEEVFLRFNI